MSERILIVNADDYARTPGVSAGILNAYIDGIVTTTTVMMNLPGAFDALRTAQSKTPRLGLGVHLNLSLGSPCNSPNKVQSLLDSNGLFRDKDHLFQTPDGIHIEEVEFEWRAQIEAFLSTGALLDHMDSHHHIALLSPDLWTLFLRLAEEYGCGVRPPSPVDVPVTTLLEIYSESVIDFARYGATNQLEQSNLPHPQQFLASFFGPGATLENLLNLLKTIPMGVSELMCHPGHADPVLTSTSGYAKERALELAVLIHPETIQTVKKLGLRLCTYRQAWNRS